MAETWDSENQLQNVQGSMEANMQENKVIVILKRIWPTTVRIIHLVLYAIFSFIKNAIQYIISQIKNT